MTFEIYGCILDPNNYKSLFSGVIKSMESCNCSLVHVLSQYFSQKTPCWIHYVSKTNSLQFTCFTKVIIEKSRGGRFLWNRNWDLGWIWAGSATFHVSIWHFFFKKNLTLKTLKKPGPKSCRTRPNRAQISIPVP